MIKSLARFATVLAVVSMFAGVARAADGYTEVNPPQPTDTGNKIEVETAEEGAAAQHGAGLARA